MMMKGIRIMSLYNIDNTSSDNITEDRFEEVEQIKEFNRVSGLYILKPEDFYKDMYDLDSDFQNYSNLHHDLRRRSNWKSLEVYGMTVPEYYEKIKHELLNDDLYDIDNQMNSIHNYKPSYAMNESYQDALDVYGKNMSGIFSQIKDISDIAIFRYTEKDLSDISEYTTNSSNPVIRKYAKKSGNEEPNAFLNNFTYYGLPVYNSENKTGVMCVHDINKFFLVDFKQKPFMNIHNGKSFSQIKKISNKSKTIKEYYNYGINSDIITEAMAAEKIKQIDENSEYINLLWEDICDIHADYNKINLEPNVPYFTPYEMERLGISYQGKNVMYSTKPDTVAINEKPIKEWFEEYKSKFNGYSSDDFTTGFQWRDTLKSLYEDINSLNEQELLNRKQSILDLGWNPEIPFNEDTQLFARRRLEAMITESYPEIDNYCNCGVTTKQIISEDNTGNIFVIFSTNEQGRFKNISLSFDENLNEVFTLDINSNTFNLGTLDEEVKVYTLKLDNELLENTKNLINIYNNTQKYNLLEGYDSNKYIKNTKIVCFNLLENLLSLAITPNNILLNESNDIHQIHFPLYVAEIYEGPIENYVIEDSSIHINDILNLTEVVSFGAEFDEDGNLLISKGKKLDYEAEYANTHLALTQYQKSNNLEGMKYSLLKLWYMNILLEEEIHSTKDKNKLSKCHKARAKIMNDIKTYMPMVMEEDPNFNIIKEYENSPFSKAKVKIKRSTIKYTIELLKQLLKLV